MYTFSEHKINDADVKGDVHVISSNDSLAPKTDYVLKLLRQKHPSEQDLPEYPDVPETVPYVTDITEKEV